MSRYIHLVKDGKRYSREAIDLLHPNARAALILYGVQENLVELLLSETFTSATTPPAPVQLELPLE